MSDDLTPWSAAVQYGVGDNVIASLKSEEGSFTIMDINQIENGEHMNTAADIVRAQLNAQGQDGNWNYDPYMHGMYNGLECALATIEGRLAQYRAAPKAWLCDQVDKPPLKIEAEHKE